MGDFQTAHDFIARTRPVYTSPKINWGEVRSQLPHSATHPLIAERRVWGPGRRPQQVYYSASSSAEEPLTFDQTERLREMQHFFSFDRNTASVSSSQTLVSRRGIAVDVRKQLSMEVLARRAASLLTATDKAQLPQAIQDKLPHYSTWKDCCFMHDEYDGTCFVCRERRTICRAALK